MYHIAIEVIRARKKEVKATTAWLAEESDISEQTVKRMLSSESPDALFGNVCKVTALLDLSLGDLDPKAAEDFDGKLVKDFLADHKKLLEEHNEFKAENESLKAKNTKLEKELAHIEAELAELRLALAHKEEMLAHKQQIVELQDQLLKLQKTYTPGPNGVKF